MRFRKSLYAIVALTVACSLLTVGLTCWGNSADAEGPHAGGNLGRIPIVAAYCIASAVGVILLGWNWLGLAEVITSMAEIISEDKTDELCRGKRPLAVPTVSKARELRGSIAQHLDELPTRIGEYAKQVKDLQLQIQLSQKRTENTEAIIYSIRDAVIVVDEFDKLLMANEPAGRLFNFDFNLNLTLLLFAFTEA